MLSAPTQTSRKTARVVRPSALFLLPALVVFGSPAAQADRDARAELARPVFTYLQKCKIVARGELEEDLTRKCRGVHGYSLLLQESDARMSLDVVSPDGKVHPLDYWSVVSNEFSRVGTKAEWRLASRAGKTVPIALIVPFHVDQISENRERSSESHTRIRYLVVAKLDRSDICVTDKIVDDGAGASKARLAADSAVAKPCLPGRETEQGSASANRK